MMPEKIDFRSLREKEIPLPPQGPNGYRHVLLLGTTGAGKTTLVRQLIGTDLKEERFPSTSTAKTTIADTEIILDEGPWRAVITFASSGEVREHLEECILAAVHEIFRDNDVKDDEVLSALLDHVNQRFRFSYVLGSGPTDDEDGGSVPPNAAGIFPDDKPDQIDLNATNEILEFSVKRLRDLGFRLRKKLLKEAGGAETEKLVLERLIEEQLDTKLREDETFQEIIDSLIGEIKKRFNLLPQGAVVRDPQDWPLTWKGEWPTEKRTEFIKSILRFSSNNAALFGQLLTPLVNGVRVAGPFSPKWKREEHSKLVLFDGEGLGHTPKSSRSVSTGTSQLMEAVDAVVIVDNAAQPMQAAPEAAIRELVGTGKGYKLILAFTHFDQVQGEDIPRHQDKVKHVSKSVENALAPLGKELGPYAKRILQKRVKEDQCVCFLENLQAPLSESSDAGKRTISQLRKLLSAIDQVTEQPQTTETHPVYERKKLVHAIHKASKAFQKMWRSRLGLASNPEGEKEHWARVKALSRRLAEMERDEYDDLRPVADLRAELRDFIYVLFQNPLRWDGPKPSEE